MCHHLLTLFCCTNITYIKTLLLMCVYSTVLPCVVVLVDHHNIYFSELLHVFLNTYSCLFCPYVLYWCFLEHTFLYLFLLYVAATKYHFESIRGAMQRCKKQYTLHYTLQYAHNNNNNYNTIMTQSYSIHFKQNFLFIFRYNCYSIYNLHMSRLFLSTINISHNNNTRLILFSSRNYCFCYPSPICYVWLSIDVTLTFSFRYDLQD